MKRKKLLALVLAASMLVGTALTACTPANESDTSSTGTGSQTTSDNGEAAPTGTVVVGALEFNREFTPFFSHSATDVDIYDKVIETLITNDREGEPADMCATYVEPEVIEEDGVTKTVYTFTLKDDVVFSDGTKPTSDDLIFALKVYCDPKYDGTASIYTVPIEGVNEYRYDDPDYATKLAEIAEQAAAFDPSTGTTDELIAYAAAKLSAMYGVGEEGFLAGGEYYDDYTVPYLPNAYQGMLTDAYIDESLAAGGNRVPDISGVEKVDDKTIKITIEGVDPAAIWNLGGIPVVPASYYDADFKKGDLSKVKAKNDSPMGTGPFVYGGFENNVVTLEANTNYWNGVPKIGKLRYQVVDESAKIESVSLGDIDISDPSADLERLAAVEEAGLHYELYDFLGYGYIGINAERVPDKNVRKGLMSLMNRGPAIEAYYGELASVLERPMSRVSWAYPENVEPYYTYSKDEALKYFEAAGYTQQDGKLVKDGKQLSVQVYVGELATHPSGPILTQMRDDMESLGAELVIQDVSQDVLFDAMDNRTADMWVAAWQSTIDPDLYQVYHSQSADNPYRLNNAELDDLIIKARQTLNIEERKEYYAKALDIVMDEAVEMPVYQRSEMVIFNPEHINVDTITKDITPFYKWDMEINMLEMVK